MFWKGWVHFVCIGSVSSMPDCLCPHHSQTESVLNVYKSHALAIMDSFHSKIVTLKIWLNYSGFFNISRWKNLLLYFWILTLEIFYNLFMFDWLFFSALHMEESVADKITSSCSKIKSAVLRITDYHSSVHNDSISGRTRFYFPPILQCILIIL